MASDAPRTSVPSADGRSAGASLAAQAGAVAGSSAGPAGAGRTRSPAAASSARGAAARTPTSRCSAPSPRGGVPAALVCMLHEDGRVSRGHGLPLALLEAQAAALGIPLVTRATTWDDYEATFVSLLHELRAQGVEAGVFGDIDLQAHRDWVEGVCEVAGLGCHLPLWQEPRRRLLGEFLAGGSRATIVAVDSSKLGAEFLGLRARRRRHRPPRGRRRRRLRRGGRVPHHGHRGAALLARRSRSSGTGARSATATSPATFTLTRSRSQRQLKGVTATMTTTRIGRLTAALLLVAVLAARRRRPERLRLGRRHRRLELAVRRAAGPITVTDDSGVEVTLDAAGRRASSASRRPTPRSPTPSAPATRWSPAPATTTTRKRRRPCPRSATSPTPTSRRSPRTSRTWCSPPAASRTSCAASSRTSA